MTIELKWHDECPSEEWAAAVMEDCRHLLEDGLECAGDLIFHHVWLCDDDFDSGPYVAVWGVEGDDVFHCGYIESPKWVSDEALLRFSQLGEAEDRRDE